MRPIPAPSKDSRGSEGMIGSWEMERGMKGLINLVKPSVVVWSSIGIITTHQVLIPLGVASRLV